jgi:hypothetical protein
MWRRKTAHLMVIGKEREKERERERLISQYLLQRDTPRDLTSFY